MFDIQFFPLQSLLSITDTTACRREACGGHGHQPVPPGSGATPKHVNACMDGNMHQLKDILVLGYTVAQSHAKLCLRAPIAEVSIPLRRPSVGRVECSMSGQFMPIIPFKIVTHWLCHSDGVYSGLPDNGKEGLQEIMDNLGMVYGETPVLVRMVTLGQA